MQISNAIEQYLVASNIREESFHTAKKFYISDMGKCHRMRFFKRKGVKTEFAPFVYWTFAMGNMLHDYGYKALEAQGILLETEESFGNEHFSGRFDGIVKTETKEKALFDFKSVGSYAMKKAMAGAPNEENIAQVLASVILVRETRKDLSNTGVLAFLNKEPNDQMPYICVDREYHLTSIREKALKQEMDTMVEYWLTNKVPNCTCPAWMKPYNSYLPICEMDNKQIKKLMLLLEKDTQFISTKQGLFKVTEQGKEAITL